MGSTKKPETLPIRFRSTLEFARYLGLSRWTVSRVINGHDDVHPDTVRRVREAINEHRFSPNPLARGLRRGRTNLVGVCVPDLEVFHLSQKLGLLHRVLEENNLQMLVSMRGESTSEEVQALNRFREMRVAGLIVIASRLAADNPTLLQLQHDQLPVTMVDPLHPGMPHSLTVNRAVGMEEAFAHLFELGHRRLVTLGLSSGGAYSRLRKERLDQLVRESKKKVHLRHLPIAEGESFYQCAFEAARAYLQKEANRTRSRRTTAVLAVNDRAAIAFMDAARQAGLRIPEDLSLIGYDNMEIDRHLSPRLTSIDTSPGLLIEQAAERLFGVIRGETLPPPPEINTRLIVRDSTAVAP